MPFSGADVAAMIQGGKANELAALLNGLAACNPASPPRQYIESIRSFLTEVRGLNQDDYRWEEPTLKLTMNSTTVSGEATYTVPSEKSLIIVAISAHVALIDPMNETASLANPGNALLGFGMGVGIRDRQLLKAMNCRVTFRDADNDNLQFFPVDNGLSLSSLMSQSGEPFHILPAPLIVPATHNLKAAFSLIKTVAASANNTPLVGADTEYGLQLHSILVRTKKSS